MTVRAILIAGPTASGKSALALALAERCSGVVINADSTQVYRELRILSARPSPEEEARVPHALYGFIPACEAYSAGRYLTDAARAIAAARAAGRIPVVVGGTGLYFKALLEGLSPIPTVPEAIRARWRAEARRLGAAVLHQLLIERDPRMAARLRPTDPQRLVRALEVLEATGRSLADWQQIPGEPLLSAETAIRLVVSPDRTELYRRCDTRFDAMLERGALEEVAALRALALDPTLPAMTALGVVPLLAHLAGDLTLDAAVAQAKAETRRYAKRQLTWLRRNMIAWKWLDTQETESCKHGEFAFIRFVTIDRPC
jgi:tRNA dimethylallyltransferase